MIPGRRHPGPPPFQIGIRRAMGNAIAPLSSRWVAAAAVLCIAAGLAGCLGEQPVGVGTGASPATGTPSGDGPGAHATTDPNGESGLPAGRRVIPGSSATLPKTNVNVTVSQPVPLPPPLSNEPSIAVGKNGLVAVAAPTGPRAGPTVVTHGGTVWVSRDGGRSFEVSLSSSRGTSSPVATCSCDTDVLARDGTLYATTYYATVNPLFNVNLAASQDAGRTWGTRNPAASPNQPVDRPWLAPGPSGNLMLVTAANPSPANLPPKGENVYVQTSSSGGTTWTRPQTVLDPPPEALPFPTGVVSIAPETVAVSIDLLEPESGMVTPLLALSHDGGSSWTVRRLAAPHPDHVHASTSVSATAGGHIFVAWHEQARNESTHRIRVQQSQDSGRSWGPVRTLPLPGNAVQPWVALREDGVVAIAHYGTDNQGPLSDLPAESPWSARVALFPSSGNASVVLANLTHEPTFRGPLCNGEACEGASPMREFLNAEWGPNGTLYTAFTDARESPDDGIVFPHQGGRITVTRIQATPRR